MTIVANTFLTFSAIGNAEDVEDRIYNIDPTDTPFQAMLGKEKISATLHEWQTQALAAAGANAQVEGDDTTFSAVTPTARVSNYAQISKKAVVVAETQDAVRSYGRKREMTYQLMLKADELKRDREFVLVGGHSTTRAPAAGNSTTARELRNLITWFTTNKSRGASGADGSSSAAVTDGTQRSLTESTFLTVWQSCWTNGGKVDTVMCGPFNKTVIGGFTGNHTRTQDTSDKRLVNSIDVYVSPFGTAKVVMNRFQRERDLFLLDSSMWALGELRPMRTVDLAKTGDATKAHIICEYSLIARQQASSGVVADLNAS